jgi:transcriptional regulator with XRE-family HTH domain
VLSNNCIKSIRIRLGFNQTEFAELIEKDKTSVSLYESGKRKPGFPTLRKIVDLANKNGIQVSYSDLRDD